MHLISAICAAVTESAANLDVVSEGWWVPILGTIVTVVAAVLTWTLKRFASYIITKMKANDAEKEAIQCLLEGMALAQEGFVREAKAASEDGKLKKDEIEKAKAMAIEHAKSIAKGPAKDLLLVMGKERLGSLIKQLLAKLTSKKEDK